jgi:hypothetical protein
MRCHRNLFVCLLPLLFATACGTGGHTNGPPQQAQLVRAISPPSRLEPPAALPEVSRAVLRTLMAAHARNMSDLVSAIMLLDYPRINAGAKGVASDASVARPLTGDATELNAQLPARFFQLQDDLRAEAAKLAVSAENLDAFQVADSYGRLSQTCVRCHAVYRAGGR